MFSININALAIPQCKVKWTYNTYLNINLEYIGGAKYYINVLNH